MLKGEDESDIELIVRFASETFCKNNLYKFMSNISSKYRNCMAFDSQTINGLTSFIAGIDPNQTYFCGYIPDDFNNVID
jgi:hypothetical protein